MSESKLAFIGAGNMARSIIGGLIAQGYPAEAISASDRNPVVLSQMVSDFGIHTGDNHTIARDAEVVVLAVKPQVLKAVAEDLRPSLSHQPLLISIAAGIDCTSLSRWLGDDQAIVRCMPNTPSLVRAGASGLYANALASQAQKAAAHVIMSAVGEAQWLEEEQLLDAVTAVSGSGPAYFFLVMEAMIEAGIELGLEPDCATDLTLQTALGAAQLARSSDVEPAELRRRVMSPGGTTEAAIKSFENDELRAIFKRAMIACANRSTALAKELGQ
ncbi:pyrroline-5-carboxylate reductase [Marinimicrobium sp. ABcell2]|uniref:pyrroline-5-carboxylate reductase n=1 Tax=Marinimicrobium sp. ABcell2 TaxID=3069751 RepID=UPI0027AEF92C|nr:pyrroline-5-carboxylate reductase [Marinimicrobium sp. ABcell2]MDQ2076585.1 pyrroline-5-carboxylate reductase [Marinimicrobium sp. ABcell2]